MRTTPGRQRRAQQGDAHGARPAPAARRWRPSSRAPRGSARLRASSAGSNQSRQAAWAPGPGRPSSTASSAAAPTMPPAPTAATAGQHGGAPSRLHRQPSRAPLPLSPHLTIVARTVRTTEVPVTSPVAILSDIHGNRQALDATLRAAREAGAESWWCLGDLVGYGADPVTASSRRMGESERCIAGNHDLGACGRARAGRCSPTAPARRWCGPARPSGSSGHASSIRLDPEDPGGVVPLFHGSPRDPVWEYVLTTEQARAALEDRRVRAHPGRPHPRALRLAPHHGRSDGEPGRAGRRAARPRARGAGW